MTRGIFSDRFEHNVLTTMNATFNTNPTPRQLRQFGWSSLVALPLAAWLALGRPGLGEWQPLHTAWIGGLAGVGLGLLIGAKVWPRGIRLIYVAILFVTWPIGLVVSELLLLAIFAVVFAPVGLAFRLLGRDALTRRIDRSAGSYWRRRPESPAAESYFRQS